MPASKRTTTPKPVFKTPLAHWLWRRNLKAVELARETGVSLGTISRMANGIYYVKNSDVAKRVREFTGLKAL